MNKEEQKDLETARLRLFNAVVDLCEDELVRSEDGENTTPRPERVRELVDECRQALAIIVMIAGPEDSLERYNHQAAAFSDRSMLDELTERAPTWTTKDGTKIPITKMTDTHLANTIAMLKRKREAGEEDIAAAYGVLGSLDPDGMASYYGAHSVADDEEHLARVSGWIAALEKEQQRRGPTPSCAVCPPSDPQVTRAERLMAILDTDLREYHSLHCIRIHDSWLCVKSCKAFEKAYAAVRREQFERAYKEGRCVEDGCPEPCIPKHQRCREHAALDWERYPPAGPVYARRIRAGENPFAKPWQEDL